MSSGLSHELVLTTKLAENPNTNIYFRLFPITFSPKYSKTLRREQDFSFFFKRKMSYLHLHKARQTTFWKYLSKKVPICIMQLTGNDLAVTFHFL